VRVPVPFGGVEGTRLIVVLRGVLAGILFDKSEGGTWTQVGNVTISAAGSNTGMELCALVELTVC
jgi:hypothetical protein